MNFDNIKEAFDDGWLATRKLLYALFPWRDWLGRVIVKPPFEATLSWSTL